jgi:2-oxoglutarate ferredoxin oxidoreductase subunit beta
MIYVLENNGVYGLTKGQFSASADVGSKSKKGEPNIQPPIDPVLLALTLGAGFVARSFSGDKAQLVPLLKAGIKHNGFAMIDVISPCVTFNDHEASTKSYLYTRQHYNEVAPVDFVPLQREIQTSYGGGERRSVTMHDGSVVHFRKLEDDYDPTDRIAAMAYVKRAHDRGEVVTGLLYIDEKQPDMHAVNKTVSRPLSELPMSELCPGSAELEKLMETYR